MKSGFRVARAVRGLALAALGLLGTAAAAEGEDPLAPFRAEAEAFAQRLAPQADRAREGRALARAAGMLLGPEDCALGRQVMERALRRGLAPTPAAWVRLGRAALCAGDARAATSAALLAEGLAADDRTRGMALLVAARALERRGGQAALAAAEAAYQRALAVSDLPAVRAAHARFRAERREAGRLDVAGQWLDTSGRRPALCVRLDRDWQDPGDLGDWVRVTPALDGTVEARGWRGLCATGADHGTRYTLRLRQGLTLGGGVLAADREVVFQVPDRSPRVTLAGYAYVLPRAGGTTVPVDVVNGVAAEVSLVRVTERNLVSRFVRSRLLEPLRPWELRELREGVGEPVWQGTVAFDPGEPNREVRRGIHLPAEALSDPGLYALVVHRVQGADAEPEGEGPVDPDRVVASQWLVSTDLGLAALEGADGLTAIVRSLTDGAPRPGVAVTLLARNNAVLGRLESGADGLVRFPRSLLERDGGGAPEMLVAESPGAGLVLLRLAEAPVELPAEAVGGRAYPGPLDAYVYTDRGVYRPGETVRAGALLRDRDGRGVPDLPLILRVRDPAGEVVAERDLEPVAAGGYVFPVPMAPGARTGRWLLALHAEPEAAPVGQVGVLVEEVVPPRLEARVQAPEDPVAPGAPARVTVHARYLFGAPGGDLRVTGEARLGPDPEPFPEHGAYTFLPLDPPPAVAGVTAQGVTDGDGRAALTLALPRPPGVAYPLRAALRAEVHDVDGRVVPATGAFPVRGEGPYLGLRREGGRALVVALDGQGDPVSDVAVTWRLVAEEVDHQWYRDGDAWRYREVVREHPAGEGTLRLTGSGPATLDLPQAAPGRYRLEVALADGPGPTALRFTAGDAPAGATPGRVVVDPGAAPYRPGERASVRVQAPFPGPGTLVVATDRVRRVVHFETDAQGRARVPVPVAAGWGSGAYALVTVQRPGGAGERDPARAAGAGWIPVARPERRLEVTLEAPARVPSRGELVVPVRVPGAVSGETVHLTAAAVDEGVLRLTDFQSPDPAAHLFGKRRLGVTLRDLYGRVVPAAGVRGAERSGGGAAGRQGAPPTARELVALFTGPVTVDGDGRAELRFPVPRYQGRLRVMAVAWSHRRVGSASAEVTVQDPVTVLAATPRFLARGDGSQATVTVRNNRAPPGEYTLAWEATGALAAAAGERRLTLARGDQEVVRLPLAAATTGSGRLDLALTGPGGTLARESVRVGVRAAYPREQRRRVVVLAPGERHTFGPGLLEGLRAQGLEAHLAAASGPGLDVPGLLGELERYPYGCVEQVASRALPLLYADRLGERWDVVPATPAGPAVAGAVRRVLERQHPGGGFGLWTRDEPADPWLSAYAMDFLTRARDAGHPVPEGAHGRGLAYLSRVLDRALPDEGLAAHLAARAYGVYVLAAAGEPRPAEARYLAEAFAGRLPGPLARAQVGAALALAGDRERARPLLESALADPGRAERAEDYGSLLRDLAGALALAAELPQGGLATADAYARLAELAAEREWRSTQELAWLTLAARGLEPPGPLGLEVAGEERSAPAGTLSASVSADTLGAGLTVANTGEGPAWVTLTLGGHPARAPEPRGQGMTVARRYHRLDGTPLAPGEAVAQGEVVVAVIEGESRTGLSHHALVVDRVPAGLEVENPRLAGARSLTALDWLRSLAAPRHQEALDDRYVAALDLPATEGEVHPFRLAYLARVVTPGEYRVPPPVVEDMYRPRYRARGASGSLTVQARGP